jgi:hypothetical protein
MPSEPLCVSNPPGMSCAIELRRPATGEVIASAPVGFAFPPPVCADITSSTTVNRAVLVSAASGCSDPNHRAFAVEVLDGPRHGTLGAPDTYGQRRYTPADRYVGPDEFTIRAVIGDQRSSIATVHIIVRGPDFSGGLRPWFHKYPCGRHGRRSFSYDFRPAGGTGNGTAPSFTLAKYPFPFNPLTLADPARPHLTVVSGGAWRGYADTGSFARPGDGTGCGNAAGPLVLHPHVAHHASTTRAAVVKCTYNSKFSYVGLYGRQGGGKPPSVRKAVAFEIIVRHGQVKGYRTVLSAKLAGAHPTLTFDRTRCGR